MEVGDRSAHAAAALRSGRRRLLAAILALAALPTAVPPAAAQDGTRLDAPRRSPRRPRTANLPPARDLPAVAAQSRRDRLPILLFFDRGDCPYCEVALRQYLVPMSGEPGWQARALFRQVEVDGDEPLDDFDGTRTTGAALAKRYGVSMTPTVLVVDAKGNVVAEAVVGLTTLDFYGAYLERAIDDGRAKLRGS